MNTMTKDDIIESLNHAAISKQGIPNEVLHQVTNALVERDALRVENLKLLKIVNRKNTEMAELRAKYDDIMEAYQNVIDEKCAGDERHCTCVPFLRMEVDRLRVALRQISNMSGETSIWNMCSEALGEVAE